MQKDDTVYLRHILDAISKIEEYVKACGPREYSVGPWTILKNISLAYCLTPLGKILEKKGIRKRVYLDLFCGAGITPLRRTKVSKRSWIVGSPIISTHMTDYPFGKYYFGDLKKKSVKLAKEIIDELNTKSKEKRNYKIFKNDANEAIGDLIPEIQSSYVFAFIDPSGFQWNWTSMEQLLRLQRFDIIMNFQTREVNRLPKGKEETFFGPCAEKVCYCTNCDEKMMAYIKQIEEFGRFVTPIKIGMNQTNQYYYHLLHISPLDTYRSVITDLKSRIETFNGESIEEIWHDLLGNVRQTTFL